MKRALALTLVICIFSFLKADAQVHRNLRTYFATHLNRPKDAVGHPVTSDSLYCIALTVNSINLDSEIKSDRIKYFALTIEQPLLGRLVCPSAAREIPVNNEWQYLPIRVLLGR